MARKRTIDPDFWTDDRVQSLPSTTAILCYVGTISQADDEGRLEWSARQLLGRIFPLREDVKMRDVEVAMDAIVRVGLVRLYEVNSRTYAVHPSWKKHQNVNRPTRSKIPEPPQQLSLNGSLSPQVPSDTDTDTDTGYFDSHESKRWVSEIETAVKALRGVELRALDPDQRFLLARYHAAIWANYRVSEAKNRSRAVALSTQIANLVDRLQRDPAKCDLRVGEYLTLGQRVFVRGGEKPWHRPLDVEAEIVVEAVPA